LDKTACFNPIKRYKKERIWLFGMMFVNLQQEIQPLPAIFLRFPNVAMVVLAPISWAMLKPWTAREC